MHTLPLSYTCTRHYFVTALILWWWFALWMLYHSLILGSEEKLKSKWSLLKAIDAPRKELDESIMLHENSPVYVCIAAKYPEDLKVVTHITHRMKKKMSAVDFSILASMWFIHFVPSDSLHVEMRERANLQWCTGHRYNFSFYTFFQLFIPAHCYSSLDTSSISRRLVYRFKSRASNPSIVKRRWTFSWWTSVEITPVTSSLIDCFHLCLWKHVTFVNWNEHCNLGVYSFIHVHGTDWIESDLT